jgi:ABC-type multidrug transport system fused ATPase/permease subunit
MAKPPTPPQGLGQDSDEPLSQWLVLVAGSLGLEIEAVMAPYTEVEWFVRGAGPALLRIPGTNEPRFLALLGSGRKVAVLGPDRKVHRVRPAVVCTALCREIEAPLLAEVDRMLDTADVPPRRRCGARTAILREQLGTTWIEGCWRLRLSRGASLWRQARSGRLPHRLLALVGMHTVQYLLWLLAWWVIGRGALQGSFDTGSLLAWALLLLTLIPCRLLATWWQGRLAISAGGLLKQWLLSGALRLDLEETRHQGAGQLLGRVIESDVVESLALSGGLLGLVAGIELVIAPVILSVGAGGWGHALLLLGWVGGTCLLGGWYFRSRQRWTAARLEMTHELVERMVGHRTRLAQEAPEHWHDGEEQAIERYLALAQAMDRRTALLLALVPGGWCVLGLFGLAPAFVSGQSAPVALAVSLGGTLLAYRALHKLAAGVVHLTGAALAWQQIAPLVAATTHPEVNSAPAPALALAPPAGGGGDEPPLLEAHELVFRYRERGAPVLQGNSLRIHAGDRLLLAGPSGGGKSTFASLLTSLRRPEAGLLLSRGLDLPTLGADGWRQRVVAAPQFHENHVLTGTFAFNLLLGRRWPPQPSDVQEAEVVCRELGLGDLLDRMPAGLWQMVGETGWQLSHGERSRLYMARALLQRADVVILDESFAALDPENLQRALHCVLTRASTLLVIAHP